MDPLKDLQNRDGTLTNSSMRLATGLLIKAARLLVNRRVHMVNQPPTGGWWTRCVDGLII